MILENNYSVRHVSEHVLPNETSYSQTYSYTFNTAGTYYIFVGLGTKDQNGNYSQERATRVFTISVTGNVIRTYSVNELKMTDCKLWANYGAYNGENKRDALYMSANIIIDVKSSISNLDPIEDFTDQAYLFEWTKNQLNNTWPNVETAVLCGIKKASCLLPLGNQGYTELKRYDLERPALCYVLNDVIIEQIIGQEAQAWTITSMSMHELGHAILNSIGHDGHGGSWAVECIMNKPLSTE